MILFDLIPNEGDPVYQKLHTENLNRHYDFFNSIVDAALSAQRPYISQAIIKAFNYHAIVCLHSCAGEFRQIPVTVGAYQPPHWVHVQALMDDFVNQLNVSFPFQDPVATASWALWRLNWIHPFVNGNGRTARLTAYYLLCISNKGLLPGTITLPELLRRDRGKKDDPYVEALKDADVTFNNGKLDISKLHTLVSSLLQEQLASAPAPATPTP